VKLLEELSAPTRIRIKEGDLFAYLIKGEYRFCRIMREKAIFWGSSFLLTYFYQPTSSNTDQVPPLTKDNLLLPPHLVVPSALGEGYFQRISNQSVGISDRRERHCFCSLFEHKPFIDEFGDECEEFTPTGGLVFTTIDVDLYVSRALGFSAADYEALPERPRPLLRESLKGKLPHAEVVLIIPEFSKFPTQRLLTFVELLSKDYASLSGVLAAEQLMWELVKRSRMGDVASTGMFSMWLGRSDFRTDYWPNGDAYLGLFTVKRGQHEEFYERINALMAKIGIQDYWIEDPVLRDWLAGTFKPAHRQPL
jgi:hypothetical protein